LTRFDTVIRNGTLVIPRQGELAATVAIADGTIAGLLDPAEDTEANETIDARGLYLFPGLIDPHMHIGFTGLPLSDVRSETRSAAIGGVTTILNYVLKSEPYDEPYREFLDYVRRLAHVDMGIHFGIFSRRHIDELPHYINDLGVSSFKFFMSYKGDEALKRGLTPVDEGLLYEFLRELPKYPGAIANIHAENIEVIWQCEERVRALGLDGLTAHNLARPGFAEAKDVMAASYLGQITGAPLYFVHISSREGIEAVRQHRPGGRVFAETTPHYLSLTVDSACGLLAKINPPVRTTVDADALWEAIEDGSIDTVGNDHAARMRADKAGDVWHAGAAFPGVGTMLSVLLDEGFHKRSISLQRIAEISSFNTARIFNLYPRKGTIQVGSDADIAIVDLNCERTVDAGYLQSRADFSPWEGLTLKGWAVRTLVRGRTVMQDGEITAPEGYGVYLPRTPSPRPRVPEQ
jgi:dihydropyrimidinase